MVIDKSKFMKEAGDNSLAHTGGISDSLLLGTAPEYRFFVENHGGGGHGEFFHSVSFYHQDGRFEDRHSDDLKKQILEAHNLSEMDIS